MVGAKASRYKGFGGALWYFENVRKRVRSKQTILDMGTFSVNKSRKEAFNTHPQPQTPPLRDHRQELPGSSS